VHVAAAEGDLDAPNSANAADGPLMEIGAYEVTVEAVS
jgi:hypothetical protein